MTDPIDIPELEAPFWEGLGQGRLLIQRCETCDTFQWPPASLCTACGAACPVWTEVSGAGNVWSSARYRRALNPMFRELVPYTVALVTLDEGPSMMGITSPGYQEPAIGDRVRARTLMVGGAAALRWEPTRAAPEN